MRFNIFVENQKKIYKHNRLHSLGDVTFKLKSNQFADLTHAEFLEQYVRNAVSHDKRCVVKKSSFFVAVIACRHQLLLLLSKNLISKEIHKLFEIVAVTQLLGIQLRRWAPSVCRRMLIGVKMDR